MQIIWEGTRTEHTIWLVAIPYLWPWIDFEMASSTGSSASCHTLCRCFIAQQVTFSYVQSSIKNWIIVIVFPESKISRALELLKLKYCTPSIGFYCLQLKSVLIPSRSMMQKIRNCILIYSQCQPYQ